MLAFCFISAQGILKADQNGDFTYTADGNGITITGYTGAGGDVAIPDKIAGLPVTTIGDRAFWAIAGLTNITVPGSVTTIGSLAFFYCRGLTQLALPNSIRTIGEGAFQYCMALSQITIPNGVTSIGNDAFVCCDSLIKVTIPESVTNIGSGAFTGGGRLMSITVAESNAYYSSSNGILFNKDCTAILLYPNERTGSYSIPCGVTNIGSYAFSCSYLNSVSIPETVTAIGDYAFSPCNLTNITIPRSVQSIGEGAFMFLFYTQGFFFKGDAPSLGEFAFEADSNATVYYLPGTTGWDTTFGGRPTSLWNPLMQALGPQTNGPSFNITGTTNIPVVVEACANLAAPMWIPLQTNTLTAGSLISLIRNAQTLQVVSTASARPKTCASERFYRLRWL